MKKRVPVLILCLALGLAFTLPALAGTLGVFGLNGGNMSAPNRDVYIDVATRTSVGGTQTGAQQIYKSYAYNTKTDTDKLSWKVIKETDLTPDLYLDITKIAKGKGTLVLATAASGQKNSLQEIRAIEDGEGTVDYAVVPVSGVAEKPKKPTIKYGYDEVIFSGATSADRLEWAFLGSKDWHSLSIYQSNGYIYNEDFINKTDIWLRTGADGDGLPSVPIKVSLLPVQAPPNPTFNYPKGEIKVKKGWLMEWVEGEDNPNYDPSDPSSSPYIAVDYEGVLDCAVLKLSPGNGDNKVKEVWRYGGGSVPGKTQAFIGNNLSFRIPVSPDGKKPGSFWANVHTALDQNDPPTLDNFWPAPKQQILVSGDEDYGGRVIEAYLKGKWKKVSRLKLSDIPDAGLQVRTAGTAYHPDWHTGLMPSEPRYLIWDKEAKKLRLE